MHKGNPALPACLGGLRWFSLELRACGETTFQGTVTVEQSSTGDAGFRNPYGP